MESLRFFLVSTMLVRVDMWPVVLLLLRNPFCSSTILSFSSHHELILVFGAEQYNLYIDDTSAIPLNDIGFLESFVLDFGIGLIMHLFHEDGILPFSKRILNRTCRKDTDGSLNKTSTGMASKPHALPLLELSNAFFTSNIEIWTLYTGSNVAALFLQVVPLPKRFCCRLFPCWKFRRELKSCFHLLSTLAVSQATDPLTSTTSIGFWFWPTPTLPIVFQKLAVS